jgi:hypothetical protein
MAAWPFRGKYAIRPFFTLLKRMVKHKREFPADFDCIPLEGCESGTVLRIYPIIAERVFGLLLIVHGTDGNPLTPPSVPVS